MKIRLNEIPEDGRSFSFTRETGEMNASLKDVLAKAPYKIDVTIRPLGNAFEMEGKLVTSMSELCSLCGWDLNLPLTKTFKEILIEAPEVDRETHHVHGSGSVDFSNETNASATYKNDVFDAGEFMHELVAISEPLYPACGDPDCEHLEEATAKRAELAAEFAKADETKSAFAALKDLHLEKKQ